MHLHRIAIAGLCLAAVVAAASADVAPPAAATGGTPTVTQATRPSLPSVSPASIGAPHECKGHYPPDAADENRTGETIVGFTIGTSGEAIAPRVVNSSGFADLDEAALACVRLWRYRPAMAGDTPVAVPWKAKVAWRDDELRPLMPFQSASRQVRTDAWHCLWASEAARALPPEFTAWLEVHIRFSTWLRSASAEIGQSSGNAALDKAAVACVLKSPHLAEMDDLKGDYAGGYMRLAWWHSTLPARPAP